ncbi:MAG: hypothetical protein AB1489_14090 [Acidobacteriota bacterium]
MREIFLLGGANKPISPRNLSENSNGSPNSTFTNVFQSVTENSEESNSSSNDNNQPVIDQNASRGVDPNRYYVNLGPGYGSDFALGAILLGRANGQSSLVPGRAVQQISGRITVPTLAGDAPVNPSVSITRKFVVIAATGSTEQATNFLNEVFSNNHQQDFVEVLKMALNDPNGPQLIAAFQDKLKDDPAALKEFNRLLQAATGVSQ